MKTPLAIGVDFGTTNTVVALGDGVADLQVGQRIATGGSRGGFAEYCTAIAANAVELVDAMDSVHVPA